MMNLCERYERTEALERRDQEYAKTSNICGHILFLYMPLLVYDFAGAQGQGGAHLVCVWP